MRFGENLQKHIASGPGYPRCVLISCCVDICYKICTVLVDLYPFINIFARFKKQECKGYFTLDLYLFRALGILSICIMLYGIKASYQRDLYCFNNFRFSFYVYIILQTLYVFYLVVETILVDCAEQPMKYRIVTASVMLLLGGAIISVYNTFWVYILDLAGEALHEDGNRNYNDELKHSDPNIIFGANDENKKLIASPGSEF